MSDVFRTIFSPCRTWRYTLARDVWFPNLGRSVVKYLNVIGLNPSTADENRDDPTVRRCLRLARDLGYDGCLITNLFAYRSTDPRGLLHAPADPIGPENDGYLLRAAQGAGLVICAWGVHGGYLHRGRDLLRLLREAHRELHCLGLTQGGQPRHPLYLPSRVRPQPYSPES
jgi:hypothetical protein